MATVGHHKAAMAAATQQAGKSPFFRWPVMRFERPRLCLAALIYESGDHLFIVSDQALLPVYAVFVGHHIVQ